MAKKSRQRRPRPVLELPGRTYRGPGGEYRATDTYVIGPALRRIEKKYGVVFAPSSRVRARWILDGWDFYFDELHSLVEEAAGRKLDRFPNWVLLYLVTGHPEYLWNEIGGGADDPTAPPWHPVIGRYLQRVAKSIKGHQKPLDALEFRRAGKGERATVSVANNKRLRRAIQYRRDLGEHRKAELAAGARDVTARTTFRARREIRDAIRRRLEEAGLVTH